MIPHKLRLHNFMCYREEQSLDFSGIHLGVPHRRQRPRQISAARRDDVGAVGPGVGAAR